MVNVVFSGRRAAAALNYSTSTISDDFATNLISTFNKAVTIVMNDEQAVVDHLGVLSERDQSQILTWNYERHESRDACIHQVIHTQSLQTPEAPAVCGWDGNFTYRELESLSTRLAHHLKDIGIAPQSMVPLCFSKSAWAIVAMLAVMKAGAAYVSLDPAHPVLRLKSILKSVDAKHVLAGKEHIGIFEDLDIATMAIDSSIVDKLPRNAVKLVRYDVQSSDPASVVFTSGSTGQPKGIVLEHSSICTSAQAHGTATGIGPHSRVLQFAAYTFDVSIQDIFTTLMRGGCVCVISDQDRLNNLSGAIQNLRVNWACLTSTVASVLKPVDVPGLKTLVLGGEPATRDVVASWAKEVELFNVYGPAESSIWTSCNRIINKDDDPANIGLALASRLWIVDMKDHNKLAPIGAIGELLLEGPLLARGYLKDEQKTRAAFIENPGWATTIKSIGESESRRLYKTGDLVQYNSDGTIRYVERKDTQVKINGQRLELGEIEHHVKMLLPEAQHIAVDVITHGSSTGRHSVAALVQFRKQSLVDVDITSTVLPVNEALQARLSEVRILLVDRLPSYMIPSFFVSLRQMPTTTSGKLDRQGLRRMISELPASRLANYSFVDEIKRAPSTEIEKKLHGLWVKALNISEASLGVGDNFFAMGGDSITAMRLVGLARTQGIPLSVANIFQHPRLADLAMHMAQDSKHSPQFLGYRPFLLCDIQDVPSFLQNNILTPLKYTKAEVVDVLPATDFQALALTGLLMKSRWMLNYFWFDGDGSLDTERLGQSFSEWIDNHDILRTVFALHGGQYYQIILKAIYPSFAIHDTTLDLEDFTKQLQATESEEGMPLGKPLVKLTLARQKHTARYRIIIRLSHAQYDGVSLPRLWESLFAGYQGQPTAPRSSFSNYLAHSAIRNSSESHEHWRRLLTGSSMTELATRDKMRCFQASDNTKTLTRNVDLASFSNSGITFATLLKAAWSFTLAQTTGKDDVVFGQVISGRNESTENIDMGDIVGPCINVIPVRVPIAQGMEIIDLLHYIQDQQVSNMRFETLGFRKIIRDCTEWPDWTYYSSVVQHENIDERRNISLGGDTTLKLGVLGTPEMTADIYVFSAPRNGGIEISLTATTGVSPSFAESLMETLCETISRWVQTTHQELVLDTSRRRDTNGFEVASKGSASKSITRSGMPQAHSKKASHLKHLIQRAWRQVLKFEGDPEMTTSFLDCGGDLISAGQIALILREEGLAVSLEDFVESLTLEDQIVLLLSA
jgi:amino acid adenylation domain-containing protein